MNIKIISLLIILNLIQMRLFAQVKLNIDSEEKPEISVQLGHSERIYSVAFSPDGKYVLSSSDDRTLKLWNVASGKEMRTFKRHDSYLQSAIFSLDGKYALAGSKDAIILLDIANGKEIRTFTGHSGEITSVAFSPDGKYVLSGSIYGTLKLWDVASGNEIKTFLGHNYGNVSVAFSPDGKYILSGSRADNTLKLWDVASGKEIRNFTGHSNKVCSVAFSPDGKYVLSGSYDETLKLWDVTSAKEIRTFLGHKMNVFSVAFSPDGENILSGSMDNTARLWDIATGKEIRMFNCYSDVYSVAFSPDGKYVLTGLYDGILNLWDVKSGHEIRTFSNNKSFIRNPIYTVKYSPSGRYIIAGSRNSTLKIFDITSGKIVKTIKDIEHNDEIHSVALSPNGKFALSGSFDGVIKLLDMENFKEIKTFTEYSKSYGIHPIAYSPDGGYALLGLPDGTLRLWDVAVEKEIRTFTGHSGTVDYVAISPDGKYALSGSSEETILWDIATGNQIKKLLDHFSSSNVVAFSPNGKYALSGLYDGDQNLWDMEKLTELHTFHGHLNDVNSVAFSPDGKYVLSGSSDKTLKLWDVASGEEIRTFEGHSEDVTTVAFSPDGKHAISGSKDATIKLWNIQNDKCTTFMENSDGSQWLVLNNDGYWDASPNGGELVAMVRGMNCWSIDQFAVKNNRPDIIISSLSDADPELIKHYYTQYQKRLRKLGLTEDQLSSDYHVPIAKIIQTVQKDKFIEMKFNLSDSKYMLKRYNIYVNDVPLFGNYGEEITGNNQTLHKNIELTGGDNKIEISCMNKKGVESYRALTFAKYDKPVKPDLYYIGFGVSKYKDKILNLKYADKDVLDLAEVLNKMKGDEFKNVYTKTFTNEEVTIENIKAAKKLLTNSKVDDTFILSIAGHGAHDRDKEDTYYFLTYNAKVGSLAATAANFELIEDLLQGISPRNKLFLMDACESGELEEGTETQYFAQADTRGLKARAIRGIKIVKEKVKAEINKPRTYLFEKDRYIYNDLSRRSGAIVFSSSKGTEFSYERDDLQNGLFTKEIINALTSTDADKNKDGNISTDELREYVSTAVARLSGDLQHPSVDRDNIYQKFGFGIVK